MSILILKRVIPILNNNIKQTHILLKKYLNIALINVQCTNAAVFLPLNFDRLIINQKTIIQYIVNK